MELIVNLKSNPKNLTRNHKSKIHFLHQRFSYTKTFGAYYYTITTFPPSPLTTIISGGFLAVSASKSSAPASRFPKSGMAKVTATVGTKPQTP